jgi:hypothetical protein
MYTNTLCAPEYTKTRQHNTDDKLQRILWHSRQWPMYNKPKAYDYQDGRSRPNNCERNRTLTGTKGHDNEGNLKSFQQDALIGYGKRVPVINRSSPGRMASLFCGRSSLRKNSRFIMQLFKTTRP